ncbi:MAG TPA: MptD family putative ECF transporter S component [Cellulomonas sp.]
MSTPSVPRTAEPTARLGIRDLVTIGIFTAILVVLSIVTGTVTAFHPVAYLFDPALLALLGGVFFLLVVLRVRRTGAVLLTSVLFGLAWGLLGGWLLAGLMLVAGVLGELVVRRTGYRGATGPTVAWVLFTLANYGGAFGTAWVATDSYIASGERSGQDPEYVTAVVDAIHSGTALVALVLAVLAAVAGIAVARRILRKHVARAAA